MNTSCPDTSVETLHVALRPFQEDSFLTDKIERNDAGNMTEDQFKKLITNEINAKRLIDKNSFSAYQLGSRMNREYCYYLQRIVFFDKKYASTGDKSMKEKGDTMKQKMDDMLAALNFMETFIKSGNQINPTESQRPASWKALGLTEKFTTQRIEGMRNRNDLSGNYSDVSGNGLALRKDMLVYSQEKNRAATSLLALYGFLNLTAVGLLIYIYRSK